ncbi:MAG TPA: NmrA family NAD(P)-binding protein [Polyangiaceae bacterium]|jgi:uncharacterized protein YbjT (DUF2867 family)
MATDTILVTGGTGNIGTAFVAALAADARAPRVRVASRDHRSKGAALVRALNPETITPVAFDVDDAESMRAALDGVTKLFVIAPFVSDMAAWHDKIAAAAKRAGLVALVVKASVTGACGPDTKPPPSAVPLGHWLGEEAFRRSFPTIAIRPNIYMQHFLTQPGLYVPRAERFYLPIGNARVSWLDARDIAALAAAFLLGADDGHAGKSYELSGPTAPTAAEIAGVLSLVAQREVRHVDGGDAFSARCKELGIPDTAKHFYGQAGEGWFAKVDDGIFVRVLGRHATSFAKFAIDHRANFTDGGGD